MCTCTCVRATDAVAMYNELGTYNCVVLLYMHAAYYENSCTGSKGVGSWGFIEEYNASSKEVYS